MRAKFSPKLLIFLAIVLALTLFFAQGNLRQDWDDFAQGIDIHIENFMYALNPERSKPISILEKEQGLKVYVGEPFIDFSQSDWSEFWNILYGAYPMDYPENERLPPRVRQLNYSEMEEKLKEWHPNPFSYFQAEHWQQFWKIAFGKKAK